MSLSVIDVGQIQAGGGQLFLAAYPATNPGSDLTPANVMLGYLGLFVDVHQKALKNNVVPWCALDSSGFQLKINTDEVEFDFNDRPAEAIGLADARSDATIVFGDVSAAKFADIISANSSEIVTIAAGVGQSGRTQILIGGSAYPTPVVAMYRVPSKKITGEFNHYVIPRAFFKVDTPVNWEKKKAVTLKVELRGAGDTYLVSPATNRPATAFYDNATAAAS